MYKIEFSVRTREPSFFELALSLEMIYVHRNTVVTRAHTVVNKQPQWRAIMRQPLWPLRRTTHLI